MPCKAPKPMFQIRDEVETNEKYREMAEDHNNLMKKVDLTDKLFLEYRRGRVISVQKEDFSRLNIDKETGYWWCSPVVEGRYTDVIVYMDDLPGIEYALNQDYLQKVKR